MKYRKIKNFITAGLSAVIYQSYIVEGVPTSTKIFATICFLFCIYALLNEADRMFGNKRRNTCQQTTKSI